MWHARGTGRLCVWYIAGGTGERKASSRLGRERQLQWHLGRMPGLICVMSARKVGPHCSKEQYKDALLAATGLFYSLLKSLLSVISFCLYPPTIKIQARTVMPFTFPAIATNPKNLRFNRTSCYRLPLMHSSC